MANFQDCSVGMKKETTYGTGVTVDRWWEFLTESFDYNKNISQGQGLRVGSTVKRSARRIVGTYDGGGDFSMEIVSKGQGTFWEQCMGSGTSTLVTGSDYLQVFTLGDSMPSATWQKGLPRTDGTVDAYTFTGAKVDSFEIKFGQEMATVSATIDAQDVTTGTAYATPSYATQPTLFHFANGAIYTGTLTEPTSTTLASATTAMANVREGTVKVSHNLGSERFNFGNGGKKDEQKLGMREITGTLVVEYDSNTLRDAVMNETPMVLLVEYTGDALGSDSETFQIVLPEIILNGKLPFANGGELITQEIEFEAYDNETASEPLWICCYTSDTAL